MKGVLDKLAEDADVDVRFFAAEALQGMIRKDGHSFNQNKRCLKLTNSGHRAKK